MFRAKDCIIVNGVLTSPKHSVVYSGVRDSGVGVRDISREGEDDSCCSCAVHCPKSYACATDILWLVHDDDSADQEDDVWWRY